MENNNMSWSNKTKTLWKAFENAVLTRDKNQFNIYVMFKRSEQKDFVKAKEKEQELVM